MAAYFAKVITVVVVALLFTKYCTSITLEEFFTSEDICSNGGDLAAAGKCPNGYSGKCEEHMVLFSGGEQQAVYVGVCRKAESRVRNIPGGGSETYTHHLILCVTINHSWYWSREEYICDLTNPCGSSCTI